MVHEAALASGKLTRGVNRGSAYLSEVIMSRRQNRVRAYDCKPNATPCSFVRLPWLAWNEGRATRRARPADCERSGMEF